jgi:hypothetical protein
MAAALRRLLRLMLYVTLMRLLGYRIRRDQTRSKSPTAPGRIVTPTAPLRPRKKHRYLDRQMCLDALADINAAFSAAAPPTTPAHSSAKPAAPPCAAPAFHIGRQTAPIPSPSTHSTPPPRAPPAPNRLRPPTIDSRPLVQSIASP